MSVIRSRRSSQKVLTREALIAAGERCLAGRGYLATTVGDVARAAGVAHGTFYVHFESKRALLDALLARFNEALRAELAEAFAGSGTMEDRVRRAARIFLDRCAEERWLVLAYAERAGAGVAIEELRDGINPHASALVRGLLAGIVAPGFDPELVVAGASALWLRVALQVVLADRSIDRARAADTLARMTTGALAAIAMRSEREEDRDESAAGV